MSFKGSTLRNLDTKGRLMLPLGFREELIQRESENRVVLSCLDGCVIAFPVPRWEYIEHKLSEVKNPSLDFRNFKRKFVGYATEVELDGQGRINIPRAHLDFGDLHRNILIIGQLERFEIWDQARFEALPFDMGAIHKELSENDVDIGL